MKQLLVFGAGKSSVYLIEYLLNEAAENNWKVIVADSDLASAKSKIGDSSIGHAVQLDVTNPNERAQLIRSADIVISLLPPSLHILVARDCIENKKNLLTASYVDEQIHGLKQQILDNNLLFLYEMGLDPGIDHMSAMQIVDSIRQQGGKVDSFKSHCGGLTAPESDDNPWHYKISWNPRNIVMAGKSGANFLEDHKVQSVAYEELFDATKVVDVPGLAPLSWYPNRDSLQYIPLYGLEGVATFLRTTLRYPEFVYGWKNLVDLKLTDEKITYQTDGLSIAKFFEQHFHNHGFSDWIQRQLTSKFEQTKELLEKLRQLLEAEREASPEAKSALKDMMMVDPSGDLRKVSLEDVKTRAAETVASQMHEANTAMKQLFHLGMGDELTMINKGECSAVEVLQFILEKKLSLNPEDKDMIVMLHEIGFTMNGNSYHVKSSLIVKGENDKHTAMAKTVGLPLGIAAKLILQNKIPLKGLQIPIVKEIYDPVMEELGELGIRFKEKIESQ